MRRRRRSEGLAMAIHHSRFLTAAVVALVVAGGCDRDDEASSDGEDEASGGADEALSGGPGPGGEATVRVTGAFEESIAGYAIYTERALEAGHFSVSLSDMESFALDISVAGEYHEPPPEGTYSVGSAWREDHVTAHFEDMREGELMDAIDYATGRDGSGSLTITASSPAEVRGEFELSARRDPGDADSPSIELSGTFHAVRQD